MDYYVVEPEVAGGFGDRTIIDWSSGKMEVKKLHYQFDGWLGDELLESTPCFIVSERLAHEIGLKQLTGVTFADVEVTVSDEFNELYPNQPLPKFVWLKLEGEPEKDDFWLTSDLNLVVSERAILVLKDIGISHAASITLFKN